MGGSRIEHLAFLIPGNDAADRPGEGLEQTLRLFEPGERLGYDGAWVRQRHLEPGFSSAAVFLAAASQRTRRIELGTATSTAIPPSCSCPCSVISWSWSGTGRRSPP